MKYMKGLVIVLLTIITSTNAFFYDNIHENIVWANFRGGYPKDPCIDIGMKRIKVYVNWISDSDTILDKDLHLYSITNNFKIKTMKCFNMGIYKTYDSLTNANTNQIAFIELESKDITLILNFKLQYSPLYESFTIEFDTIKIIHSNLMSETITNKNESTTTKISKILDEKVFRISSNNLHFGYQCSSIESKWLAQGDSLNVNELDTNSTIAIIYDIKIDQFYVKFNQFIQKYDLYHNYMKRCFNDNVQFVKSLIYYMAIFIGLSAIILWSFITSFSNAKHYIYNSKGILSKNA